MRSVVDYTSALIGLLPPGIVFNNEPGSGTNKLLTGLADELVRIDSAIDNLITESNPVTMSAFIDSRYDEAGLPINCTGTPASSQTQRKLEVLAQWRAVGGCTVEYFHALLETLGVQAYIEELYTTYPQASCISTCVDYVSSPDWEHTWRIVYEDQTAKKFIVGSNQAGHKLGTYGGVLDKFKCIIERLKPAHTYVQYVSASSL